MLKLIILLCSIYGIFAQQNTYCEPFEPDGSSPSLPKLPNEFQMHVEASFISKGFTGYVQEYYDSYDNVASVITTNQNQITQGIFDYKHNQVFISYSQGCQYFPLNEDMADNSFFGIHFITNTSETIGLPSEVLHFNNNYTQKFIGTEMLRGIPVNHWQSCQNWPEFNANFLLDYYFTTKAYNTSVLWDADIDQIPVAAKVEGIITESGIKKNFSHEYNYFEFRTRVEDKTRAFLPASGIYCQNTPLNATVPKIPNQFRYVEETVMPTGQVLVSIIHYDFKLKTLRIDTKPLTKPPPAYTDDPLSIIHDFTSGVGFIINRNLGNCTQYSLGSNLFDLDIDTSFTVQQLAQNLGFTIMMRNPQEFFYLDENYYYTGQKMHRGILCDVYVSKRTDMLLPSLGKINYTIFEWHFMSPLWSAESIDETEKVNPIAVTIRIPELDIEITNNIFDFDSSTLSIDTFDVTQCYNGRQKTRFAISFGYSNGVDEILFQDYFRKLVEDLFLFPLYASVSEYNLSPLRFIPPKAVAEGDRFLVYSGVTDYPQASLQFSYTEKSNIDPNKAKYIVKADSAEKCAVACLNSTLLQNDKFICLSFDYCSTNTATYCSLYNASRITDPLIHGSDTCDHYSKNTNGFDSVPKDIVLKAIKNSVLNKEFNISFNNQLQFVFPGLDINEVPIGGEGISFGNGSNDNSNMFLREFKPHVTPSRFNESAINSNNKLFLRSRIKISVIECARFCVTESAFICESFTYDFIATLCQWSNIYGDLQTDASLNGLILSVESKSALYMRDPLFNYIEYPYKVTPDKDYKVIVNVDTDAQCAKLCDAEKTIYCRSFNYCPTLKECYLSTFHINNPSKNESLVSNPICTHYSKRSINDFELIPQLEILSPNPSTKLFNLSVEQCAELCSNEDSYLCRSFSYYTSTKQCYMYRENLADSAYIDIKTEFNVDCNHYSRIYYTQNGMTYSVTPLSVKKDNKYSGGAIIGVLIAVIIGGFVLGLLFGFIYSKRTNNNFSPQLKFSNKNYENS